MNQSFILILKPNATTTISTSSTKRNVTTTISTSSTKPTQTTTSKTASESTNSSESTSTSSATGTTTPNEPDYLLGDVNDDGEISFEDAQLTLIEYVNTMSGLDSGFNEKQKLADDINGDKEISVEDAKNILIYYVSNTLSGQNVTWDELLGKNIPSEQLSALLKRKERLLFWHKWSRLKSEP